MSRTIPGPRVEPRFSNDPSRPRAIAGAPTEAAARETRTSLLARMGHYAVHPVRRGAPAIFGMAVLTALGIGWFEREEGHLTPEVGLGYWLGIVGATMMLLLMIYPLRKRLKLLRHLGQVPDWFRLHMVLGILGPTLILFHSNFKLGSLNSNVALTVMLIVVTSGVVGRFIYARVHRGLYGRKITVGEILDDARALKQALGDELAGAGGILEDLRVFESETLAVRSGVVASLGALLASNSRARRHRRSLLHKAQAIIAARARNQNWTRLQKRTASRVVRKELSLYFAAVNKAARFAVFERLLALWHLLHFPLFLLLVATAVLHVIAVHLY